MNWDALFHDASATQKYFDSTQNSVGAAFDAAVLIGMEDAPVDIATLYTGTTAMWELFTAASVSQKPYYAFLAFTELLKSPKRLAVDTAADSPIRTLAGISADGRTIRILLSNPSDLAHVLRWRLANLPWSGAAEYQEQGAIEFGSSQRAGYACRFHFQRGDDPPIGGSADYPGCREMITPPEIAVQAGELFKPGYCRHSRKSSVR